MNKEQAMAKMVKQSFMHEQESVARDVTRHIAQERCTYCEAAIIYMGYWYWKVKQN